MPEININEILNINVTHGTPTPVDPSIPVPNTGAPNTGFFGSVGDFFGNLNTAGWFFIVILAVLAIVGIVFFLLSRKFHRKAYTLSSVLLAVATLGLAFPAIHSFSSALDAVEHTTNFNISASPDGAVATANTEGATVGVDAPYGYTVSAYIDGADSALHNADNTNQIKSITIDYAAPELFEANSYGVKSSATNSYVPLSTTAGTPTLVADVDAPATPTTPLTLTYAAKLNTSTPESTYTGKIVYTVVPKPAPTFAGITKMQEMTTEICNNETTPSSSATTPTTAHTEDTNLVPVATLTDTRDNKTYQIAKLADGKCWMTQNLDLNLSSDTQLTPNDSDIADNWTPQTTFTAASQWTATDNTNLNSLDLGDYYYDGSTIDTTHTTGASYSDFDGFSTTGNQHYHVGNLYSYNASTAGSGASVTASRAIAPYSICPKGWRLPVGSYSGDFRALIDDFYSTGPNVQKLIDSPIYMVRGGSVAGGQLLSAGYQSMYWSSMSEAPNRAYRLYFGSTGHIETSNYSIRSDGHYVRCIAH